MAIDPDDPPAGFVAPRQLAGLALVGARQIDGELQLRYGDAGRSLTVVERRGRLDTGGGGGGDSDSGAATTGSPPATTVAGTNRPKS